MSVSLRAAAAHRPRVVATVAAALVFLAACMLTIGGLADRRPWGDVGNYERYGRLVLDGEIPYHDFYMEYPPGALPVFVAPATVTTQAASYLDVFKLLMTACGLAALAAAAYALRAVGAGQRRFVLALGAIAVAPLALGHVFLNRYDVWAALLGVLVLAALLARRTPPAAALLALAFAAKVFALAALPVVAIRLWRTDGARALVRAAAAFAVTSVAAFGFFLVVAFGGIGFSFYTQARRHLQIESVGASLLLAAEQLGLYRARIIGGAPGSIDLDGFLPNAIGVLTSGLALAAVAAVAAAYWRGPETDERLVVAFAASVTAFTVFAKVISPQFLVWLVPLVPLVSGRRGALATGVLLAALVATQIELQGYEGLAIADWAVWVLLLRNVLLLALFALLLLRLREPVGRAVA